MLYEVITMAYGLPIISTNKCVAALELIDNDQCIVESENVEQLGAAIRRVIYDEELQLKLSLQNLEKIQQYTIEKMVEAHTKVINKN